MVTPFLSAEQQGLVVFRFWQSLAYHKRMIRGIGLILTGFAIQYLYPGSALAGIPFLIAGNLFLIVKGYDNRVRFGKYSAEDAWEKVGENKLPEIEQLIRKMRKWDRSMLDISNPLGKFCFFSLAFLFFVLFNAAGLVTSSDVQNMIALNVFVLLVPHWFTGKRDIMTQPKLQLKISMIRQLVRDRNVNALLANYGLEYYLLLKGKDKKAPDDIKFRVCLPELGQDFLGVYGQIVTNDVGDKVYPYFYTVLVAKTGYGLKDVSDRYSPPRNITKEYKKQQDAEVLIIRQTTTKTSGYHTNHRTVCMIFLEGLRVAFTKKP